jgi:hypothetical protein
LKIWKRIFNLQTLISKWLSKMKNPIEINENCELVSAGEAVSFSSLVLINRIIRNGEKKSAGPQWAESI